MRHNAHGGLHARSNVCASNLEARQELTISRRQDSLAKRQAARGLSSSRSLAARNVFSTIQNSTCALAPETVWGPDGIDGELHRHDVREDQKGIDLYLDIGIIDVETCEPLPDAWLTIWVCVPF